MESRRVDTQERMPSRGEEIANSVSHGVGCLAALVATPFLVLAAARRGGAIAIVGARVFRWNHGRAVFGLDPLSRLAEEPRQTCVSGDRSPRDLSAHRRDVRTAAERVRYGHFVWHVFVLMGTVCHLFAVLWYAA